MYEGIEFVRGSAAFIRRAVFGGAIVALGVAAIVLPGSADVSGPQRSGFCAVSASLSSSSIAAIGTPTAGRSENWSSDDAARFACAYHDDPRIVVELAVEPSPVPTPSTPPRTLRVLP